MTTPQISALEWAVKVLPRSNEVHLATLIAMLNNAKSARNNNAMPASENDLKFSGVSSELLCFMADHGITIPNKELSLWRMLPVVDRCIGTINALPESRGRIICTNGILCYIVRHEAMPYLGHLEWFRPDEDVPYTKLGGRKAAMPKDKKPSRSAREEQIMAYLIA